MDQKPQKCPYILGLGRNFCTIRKGPYPLRNEAFLTNIVILVPRPNRKLFDHEKWFLTYLTYIKEFTMKNIRISEFTKKNIRIFTHEFAPPSWPLGLIGIGQLSKLLDVWDFVLNLSGGTEP